MPEASQKISGLGRSHIAQLMIQLADLLEAGCSLSRALDAIARQASQPPLEQLATRLSSDIQNGVSLAKAMESIEGSFTVVQISMIHAAETGGFLQKTLSNLAEHITQRQESIKQVKARLAYPIMLCVIVICSIVFLLAFVVPKFTAIYQATRQALPTPTQYLLSVSNLLETGWPYLLFGVLVIVLLLRWGLRLPALKNAWDALMLKLPIVGPTQKCWMVYRFASTMSLLLEGGVTALKSLQLAGGVIGNAAVRQEISQLATAVEQGQPISQAMQTSRIFDATTLEMISVSEATGKLGQVFSRLAAQRYRYFQTRIALLLSLAEPVIIVILSIVVGFTVMALLLPVFSMDALID